MSRAVLAAALFLALCPATALAGNDGISDTQATRIANRDPNVVKERRENGELTHSASNVEGQ